MNITMQLCIYHDKNAQQAAEMIGGKTKAVHKKKYD